MPLRLAAPLAAVAAALACSAAAADAGGSWAAPQIRAVTAAGVLGSSPSGFAPTAPLTEGALQAAVHAVEALQHPPAPKPPPLALATTVGPGSTVGGVTTVELDVTGRSVDHVALAVDGAGAGTADAAPYAFDLDTTALADGPHTLAAEAFLTGGGYAIATWQVTVANAPGAPLAELDAALPIAKQWLPGPTIAAPVSSRLLYRAGAPARAVTVKELDAALVDYLGLAGAAREIQATLARAGLHPPARTGSEAVARMLGLRLDHPARDDSLELLPTQPVTRAEAAYSFARVLALGDSATQAVEEAAAAFALPALTPWQTRILTTAVRYVGYPYVWGGTSPTAETLFGVRSAGGFDCSGFVWRVYKLTRYAGEGRLADVLRGRTTYVMSGEVPRAERIARGDLQPGDVMFFGAHGPRSQPGEVDHTAIYLGGGWFVQSSGAGVTLLPFAGPYVQSYAWGRRPLREAGLT